MIPLSLDIYFTGFYKGLVPLWARQIPYTMMKFACFERTVEALYKYVVPKPRTECSKSEQLGVTFVAGMSKCLYLNVGCAICWSCLMIVNNWFLYNNRFFVVGMVSERFYLK